MNHVCAHGIGTARACPVVARWRITGGKPGTGAHRSASACDTHREAIERWASAAQPVTTELYPDAGPEVGDPQLSLFD